VKDERIDLVHRPETETQLRHGKDAKRPVAVSIELATMLGGYF
jgi:hypothetical protein